MTPDTTPDSAGGTFATLTFSIDDSANKTYDATDLLQWKGSFKWNAETNVLEFDGAWGGPYPLLYDDGPAPGGHEADGATAGDNIWTTAVLIATPETDLELEYGAAYGEGGANWIWTGPNGKVTVPAGSTDTIAATGLVIAPQGTVDLVLTIDVSGDGANLDPLFQGTAYTDVKVKGSAWGWAEKALVDDGTKGDETSGDGIYTFRLSDNLGKHDGLLKRGDMPQFVFVLGGVEYKAGGAPPTTGVAAWLSDGTTTIEIAVANMPEGDKNTFVAVPMYTTVSFEIDDSVNQTYDAADNLEWKGSFKYDAETNAIEFDGSWGGPYVALYDDGPAPGGHEPFGAVAGDHKWSAEVLVPNTAQEYEYGAQRGGGQWIWTGSNGKFSVTEGSLTPIVAPGLTIAAFGTIDFRLEIDVSNDGANLNALFQGVDYSGKVKVKGSAWGWGEVECVDDGTKGDTTSGDGIHTFVLSENLGKHDGLLFAGNQPEWVFVLDGVEYKGGTGAASEGVTAYSDAGAPGMDYCVAAAAECAEEAIETAGNGNTMVTIGE